jgi:hypothetical protein
MSLRRSIAGFLLLALPLAPMLGCREEGPAEKTGKKIDKAVDDLKDKVNPPGPMEKAGRKIDEAVDGR